MQKTINITALVVIILLVASTMNITDALISFVLVGEIPGTDTNLSPSLMMAIMITISGFVLFEIAARRYATMQQLRKQILQIPARLASKIS